MAQHSKRGTVKRSRPTDIARIFADGALIDEAIREAGRVARRRHKLAGHPIVVSQNGRPVRIKPEDIVIYLRQMES